jgi:O-antigen/teichoic acid export membrane protein
MCLIVFAHRFQIRRGVIRLTMIRHWRFGRWICAGQMTDVSQQYCLHWLLLLMVGTAATGVYSACSVVVAVFNPVILGIGNVLLARAAQLQAVGGGHDVRRVVWKATVVLTASMSVLCLAIVLFAQRALDTLYGGADFAGQGTVVAVLALTALISTLSFPAETGLRVMERPDINFKVGFLGLGLTLCSAGPLIAYYGLLGGTIAALIGTAFVSSVLALTFHRLTKPAATFTDPGVLSPAHGLRS